MKTSTKYKYFVFSGIAIISLGFTVFNSKDTSEKALNNMPPPLKEPAVITSAKKPLNLNKSSGNEQNSIETTIDSVSDASYSENYMIKKDYNDDWCISNIELSEHDYQYAQEEIQDWNIFQGKVRAKGSALADADDSFFPNNDFIESYEALPLKELESLAESGDKWAMVAFIQNPSSNGVKRNEFARKLLVQGAPYYALEQLVLQYLSTAKTQYRHTNSPQESMKPIIEALAYAYWGMENYSISGVTPYIAVTSREPFKSEFPLDTLIKNAEPEIKARYKQLSSWIQQERDKLGIQVPEPPKAVKNEFAGYIAIKQQLSKKEMDFLGSLNITKANPIMNTPCVGEHLADIKEGLK